MHKIIFIVFFLINILIFTTCKNQTSSPIKPIVENYYQEYIKRNNFKVFLSYYSDDIVLEDIISGAKIEGKKNLETFFDWENPNFQKTDSATLVIESLILDENVAVAKGYFTPFKWSIHEFEAMHFTTILYFNAVGKIEKQVDWINYPSNLLDYQSRQNANRWIAEQAQ